LRFVARGKSKKKIYMNEKFENQKEQLVSLKHEISLLHQQINYLLRNEKALELLDLDVLMNRTHVIYDLLCGINLGENDEDQDMEIDPEALAGLFGVSMQDEEQPEPSDEEQMEQPEEVQPEEQEAEQEPMETAESHEEEKVSESEEPTEIAEDEPVEEVPIMDAIIEEEEPISETVEEETEEEETNQQIEENQEDTNEIQPKETPIGDEFGFFFRFEDIPPIEEKETVEEVKGPILVDDKLVHFVNEVPEEEIPERDRVDGEHLVQDNPFEMPKMENESAEFELTVPETLGEKMIQEDHSLAAKLQQNPVKDLKAVIGINDKFLFVNELFGGSMEKYNKSIENLNDLKTLNGAMIYLNELKIELQWNSSNEAYRKLSELVRRKYE